MRTLLLLSTLVAIAACSDNQQPTTPATSHAASRDASPAGEFDQVARANGKPQPGPIGFTQVAEIQGQKLTVNAGIFTSAAVNCPAGTAVTGGGYELEVVTPGATFPLVVRSVALGANPGPATGWWITLNNLQPGSGVVTLTPYVNCAS